MRMINRLSGWSWTLLAGCGLVGLLSGCAQRAPMQDLAPAGPSPMVANRALPPARQFQDYGTTPFTYTQDDRKNTFAVDVDTASYTIARRHIRTGQLPPAEAVRTEEFINALDYNYPSPASGELAIHLEACPAPFRDNTVLLRIALQARRIHPVDRKPANIVLVLDASGSMAETGKLDLAKQACRTLLEQLDERDRVAVVQYNFLAQPVLKFTRASERGFILDAIGKLRPAGSTSVRAGLDAGYQLANEAFDNKRTNRVILMSDGVANTDSAEADYILAVARGGVKKGITLTTIGLGFGEYNDVLLEQLADKGDGNYFYVDSPQQASRVLGEKFTQTSELMAQNVKVQVSFDDKLVRRYRLMGYENRALANKDFRNDKVDSGDMGAGDSVTALYAVELRTASSAQDARLATVSVRYKKPGSVWPTEISQKIGTSAIAGSFASASDATRLAVSAACFAERLRCTYWSAGYTLADVATIGRDVHVEPTRRAELDELLELIAAADRLAPAAASPASNEESERRWWAE